MTQGAIIAPCVMPGPSQSLTARGEPAARLARHRVDTPDDLCLRRLPDTSGLGAKTLNDAFAAGKEDFKAGD
jgi:hypothetical protein